MANNEDEIGIAVINGRPVQMRKSQMLAYVEMERRRMSQMAAALRSAYEGNPEVQRNRLRSKDETASDAVDLMTGSVKRLNDAKAGTSTSEEAAREKAREVAKKAGIADA